MAGVMLPDHDRPTNPAWPNPLDGPVLRARQIARMYRARLRALNPQACDQADDVAAGFGETWMLDRPDIIDPDRALTTAEAAELVGETPHTIRKWACAPHPVNPGEPLLPRFKMVGRERTYLAGLVLAAAATVRREQNRRGR